MPRRPSTTRADRAAEELRAVVRTLIRRVRAESGDQTYTRPQISVLRVLADGGPRTTADLARVEHITPQAMGALVAELERAGLVRRTRDPGDGRRRPVSLTAAGRRAVTHRRARSHTWLARAIHDTLDPDEQRQLLAALPLLRRLADA